MCGSISPDVSAVLRVTSPHPHPGAEVQPAVVSGHRAANYWSVTRMNAYPTTRLCQRITPSTKLKIPGG